MSPAMFSPFRRSVCVISKQSHWKLRVPAQLGHISRDFSYKNPTSPRAPVLEFKRTMGQIVQGKWEIEERPASELPPKTEFDFFVTKDGSKDGFKAEAGRYHLYLNFGCPYAHKAHLLHALKGLDELIDISVVDPYRTEYGWSFNKRYPGATGDKLFPEHKHVYEVYVKASPNATARASVPILYDTKTNKIVSSESGQIILQFNEAFNDLGASSTDYYPKDLQEKIDLATKYIVTNVAGVLPALRFSNDEEKKKDAREKYVKALSELDDKFSKYKFIMGDSLTLADIHLFVSLIRFLAVPKDFLPGIASITDYPYVFEWIKDVYQTPGVASTVHFEHIYAIFGGEDAREKYAPIPTAETLGLTAPSKRFN